MEDVAAMEDKLQCSWQVAMEEVVHQLQVLTWSYERSRWPAAMEEVYDQLQL